MWVDPSFPGALRWQIWVVHLRTIFDPPDRFFASGEPFFLRPANRFFCNRRNGFFRSDETPGMTGLCRESETNRPLPIISGSHFSKLFCIIFESKWSTHLKVFGMLFSVKTDPKLAQKTYPQIGTKNVPPNRNQKRTPKLAPKTYPQIDTKNVPQNWHQNVPAI